MSEFTPEQEIEIQKRIEYAQQEAKAREQWAIAGDQFFREAIISVEEKVGLQLYDPYILEVGKHLHKLFRESNILNQHLGNNNEVKQD